MGPTGRGIPAGYGRRRGGLRIWPLLLFGAYFVYYCFSHQQDASFTGRRQLVDTSIEQEVALGGRRGEPEECPEERGRRRAPAAHVSPRASGTPAIMRTSMEVDVASASRPAAVSA